MCVLKGCLLKDIMCVGAILSKEQLEGFCLICRGNQQCFNVELCRGRVCSIQPRVIGQQRLFEGWEQPDRSIKNVC